MSHSQIHTAVSLFTSAGIGDLALRDVGARVLVANEILEDRASVFRRNFPDTKMLVGDIHNVTEDLIGVASKELEVGQLDLLLATPPCQGMSKNGRGKLLRGVRDGLRDQLDPRNQLATAVIPIARRLRPKLMVFENVPEMESTLIEDPAGELVGLLDFMQQELKDYLCAWRVVEFADYGIPQRRQRLITVFLRRDVADRLDIHDSANLASRVYPEPSHSGTSSLLYERWVSVEDAISDLPALDAGAAETATSDISLHSVPLLDAEKYWWVRNAGPGASAFDNQCVNPECGDQGNPTHGSDNSTGVNRASGTTPIYCQSCGELLPRPVVWEEGRPRLMKGFTSAYKRMRGDLPASALTKNLSYACSDQKIHPTQNRVLSLLEASTLHTITDYEWYWEDVNGNALSSKVIREAIGESIPPRGLAILLRQIIASTLGADTYDLSLSTSA
jgi:DNA (cytosine-5)-methyltransferase 1